MVNFLVIVLEILVILTHHVILQGKEELSNIFRERYITQQEQTVHRPLYQKISI